MISINEGQKRFQAKQHLGIHMYITCTIIITPHSHKYTQTNKQTNQHTHTHTQTHTHTNTHTHKLTWKLG